MLSEKLRYRGKPFELVNVNYKFTPNPQAMKMKKESITAKKAFSQENLQSRCLQI